MTDDNVTNRASDQDGDSGSKDAGSRSDRASARTKRARRLVAIVMIVLLLLLCGVTALFVRAVAPLGAPDEKVDATGMEWVRSIYGYGKAEADQLRSPNDVAIGSDGTIWVADTGNSRVVGFAPDGSYRALIHQGPAYSSPKALVSATGVNVYNGQVWVTDYGRNKVDIFTSDNQLVREFDVPLPTNVSIRDGRVAVGSYSGIAITNERGNLIKLIGTHGKAADEFDNVQGIYIAKDGTIYATDTHNNRLRAFDRNGKALWSKQLGEPSNKALSAEAKSGKMKGGGKYTVELPAGLTMDGAGRLVFVDPFEFAIVVADPKDGTVLAKYGEDGSIDGKFAYPTGIEYDPQRDWFAVADTSNDRVQIVRIPGSGGGPLAAMRRLTTGWLKICGIPLLLLIVAAVLTALMRRRKRGVPSKDEGNDDEGSVHGEAMAASSSTDESAVENS